MVGFSELNSDQLDSLSKLFFDIAKVAFGLAILPAATSENILIIVFRAIIAMAWGIVFTYMGLILLKIKKNKK